MNEGIKNKVANVKGIKNITDLYKKQTPKRKKIFWGCVVGVSLVVIASMTMLYSDKSSYKEVFPNMEGSEASAVATALTEMQIECKQTSDGKIMVPSKDYDRAIMSLVSEGFPKTTLAYDIFDKNVGIASTDSERQQYLIFQLNDRIAETIKKIKGIKNATVTLNIPKKEGYLIDDSANTGSASVMIEMEYGETPSPKQVLAIKKLVSASVPDLSIQNVVVADAATGIAMSDGEEETGGVNLGRLGFETQVEQRMADKVMNLLTLAYGRDNIRVSATVNLDYDKMITEQQQYIPEQDGGNVTSSKQEQYKMDGEKFASGVAGEEDNTDLPVYVDEDGDGAPEYIDYSKNVDYLVSYIKTRIQKDSAIIKDASIAVALKVSDLSEQSKEAIIDSVSKATGIAKDKISVNNFNIPVTETQQEKTGIFGDVPMGLIIVIGISSLALIVLIALIVMKVLKKKKAQKAAAEAETQLGLQQSEALAQLDIETKKLREAAQAEKRQEDIIIEEVQEFADENPQIAAALIRNWLRGED